MMENFDPYNDDYEMFSLFSMKKPAIFDCGDRVKGKLLIREIGLISGAHSFSIKWFLIISMVVKSSVPFIARSIEYRNPFIFIGRWDSALFEFVHLLAGLII